MDIKTLSAMIGHVSAETTLNIYSHITDTMQQQAAARIDREIAGADTPIPEPNATDKAKVSVKRTISRQSRNLSRTSLSAARYASPAPVA